MLAHEWFKDGAGRSTLRTSHAFMQVAKHAGASKWAVSGAPMVVPGSQPPGAAVPPVLPCGELAYPRQSDAKAAAEAFAASCRLGFGHVADSGLRAMLEDVASIPDRLRLDEAVRTTIKAAIEDLAYEDVPHDVAEQRCEWANAACNVARRDNEANRAHAAALLRLYWGA